MNMYDDAFDVIDIDSFIIIQTNILCRIKLSSAHQSKSVIV